jgi:hypothetical protein
MHKEVAGFRLRTSFAESPDVAIQTGVGDRSGLTMTYYSSGATSPRQRIWQTRLTFENVVYYEWNAFEFRTSPACPDDYEFTLIELRASPIVAEILDTGRYIGSGLKHLRITFDDHGVYDIVCESFHTESWEGPELQYTEDR